MNRVNWHCPGCNEQHEARADICWKCGCDRDGNTTPEFEITEPVKACNQAPEDPKEVTEPASLQLPTVTYFSIPIYLLVTSAITCFQIPKFINGSLEDLKPIPLELVLHLIGAVLIGVPALVVYIRDLFDAIRWRNRIGPNLIDAMRPVAMFLLPPSFRERYPWFVYIYYGSVAASCILPSALAIWTMAKIIGASNM